MDVCDPVPLTWAVECQTQQSLGVAAVRNARRSSPECPAWQAPSQTPSQTPCQTPFQMPCRTPCRAMAPSPTAASPEFAPLRTHPLNHSQTATEMLDLSRLHDPVAAAGHWLRRCKPRRG
ncbi:hypothetical protein T492DRAFT_1073037 [Pavlovales sp. CCMP2436]|nr:hypothetical protein T492DRAFT_1073037 [Pavlovales sp. CCMP2436]